MSTISVYLQPKPVFFREHLYALWNIESILGSLLKTPHSRSEVISNSKSNFIYKFGLLTCEEKKQEQQNRFFNSHVNEVRQGMFKGSVGGREEGGRKGKLFS